MFTEQLTQALAVLGQLPAANQAAATYNLGASTGNLTNGIDMRAIRRLLAVFDIGVYGTNANVQGYFQASANLNMAGAVNVAAAIPLVANTNNRVETLEVRADQLPAGTRYVSLQVVVNTASVNLGVVLIGGESAYKPANQFNTANVLDQALVT
jgi:hypothetical protein